MSIIKRITKKVAPTETVEGVEVAAMPEVKAKKTVARKAVKKVEETKSVVKMVSAFASQTLLAPLVTEKAAHMSEAGVYAFLVPISANRVAVGQAFKELYKTTPVKVNIIRVHGKEHRFGGVTSRASDWKKALVTVKKGTRIDIFEKI